MATTQSQAFRGGSVSPGQSITEDDLKSLVINRKTAGNVQQQKQYDPLQGEVFDFGRIHFKNGTTEVGSYDPFDSEQSIKLNGNISITFDPYDTQKMSGGDFTTLGTALQEKNTVELVASHNGDNEIWRVQITKYLSIVASLIAEDTIYLATISRTADGNGDHAITLTSLNISGDINYAIGLATTMPKRLLPADQAFDLGFSENSGDAISIVGNDTLSLKAGTYMFTAEITLEVPVSQAFVDTATFTVNGIDYPFNVDCSNPVGTKSIFHISKLIRMNSDGFIGISAKSTEYLAIQVSSITFSIFSVETRGITDVEYGTLDEVIAPDYVELTFPIAVYSYCTHEGKMYRSNTTISTPETFNPASWDETDCSIELSDLYDYIGTVALGLTTHYHGNNSTTGISHEGTAPSGVTDPSTKMLLGDGSWKALTDKMTLCNAQRATQSYGSTYTSISNWDQKNRVAIVTYMIKNDTSSQEAVRIRQYDETNSTVVGNEMYGDIPAYCVASFTFAIDTRSSKRSIQVKSNMGSNVSFVIWSSGFEIDNNKL